METGRNELTPPRHVASRSASTLSADPGNQRRPHLPQQRPQQINRIPLTVAEHRESGERELLTR